MSLGQSVYTEHYTCSSYIQIGGTTWSGEDPLEGFHTAPVGTLITNNSPSGSRRAQLEEEVEEEKEEAKNLLSLLLLRPKLTCAKESASIFQIINSHKNMKMFFLLLGSLP